MLNEIYLHDYSQRLHKAGHSIDLQNLIPRSQLNLNILKIDNKTVGELIDLEINPEVEKMPSRKAMKLMRKDSIASFLTAQEIIDRQNLSEQDLDELSFFVINGNCLDQVQDEIGLVAGAFLENSEDEIAKRNASLQVIMPPLFALKVLTNGTQSVIAQELKIRGNSTTLGNTSHAFFDSLTTLDTFFNTWDLKGLITCSTGAGLYTLFNHQKNYESKQYHLSLSAASALVSKDKQGAIARIAELDNKKRPPKLGGPIEISSFDWVTKEGRASLALYTGIPADDFNTEQMQKLESLGLWERTINLSSSYGYLGASSLNISMIAACEYLKNNNDLTSIDLINIDPYGRECLIKIERVEKP